MKTTTTKKPCLHRQVRFLNSGVFIKLTVVFILFLIISLQPKTQVYATQEFDTDYQINYTVNDDASVFAEQKITLTNKLPRVYATQYQITLGTVNIRNIKAWDDTGPLEPELITSSNTTTIKLGLKQQVVGKDQQLNFGLSYFSTDYTSLNGQVLEIGVPKIADAQELKSLQVVIKVPQRFENPIYFIPEPAKTQREAGFNLYFFSKNQLVDQSIVASFGESQIFNFNLFYHLKNSANAPSLMEIALPPDTPFQKLYLETLSPKPLNVYLDNDANWLAKYELEPNTTLDIIATGSAQIFFEPKTEIKVQPVADFDPYLKSSTFWEVDNEEIKELSSQFKTVKEIYQYVVKNLSYNYEKINSDQERLGAVGVLSHKNKAVCMEFTDLFVALARAAGFPSREVNGYAYTNNPKLKPLSLSHDILHSWPEYYDKERKIWLAVDPTWENTTAGIDFFSKPSLNHFSFVFHGHDSSYPYTPGSYKQNGQESKDVQVSFGKLPEKKESFDLTFDFPPRLIAGTVPKGMVRISNLGNTAIYEDGYDIIPPFGFIEQKITLPKSNLFTSGKIKTEFSFKGQKESVEVEVISPMIAFVFPGACGLIFGFAFYKLLKKLSNHFKIKKENEKVS
ncbi:MAG TPA: transglutaminase-like domain-containing protein [Candidatus Bathyarchaeia archaeon]|nr:transglutaminase-like domain-containing protein [Candidatus Bathyarchaeia archaeon]